MTAVSFENISRSIEASEIGIVPAEAEQVKLFRNLEDDLLVLQNHIGLSDELIFLWRTVIAFENFPFQTLGRGREHTGAKMFQYTVSRSAGAGGRHYAGQSIEGYGNELWIKGKKKSISRSTIDLGYRNALEIQRREGFVSGPRKLGIPGSGSYLFPMFLKFGVIRAED